MKTESMTSSSSSVSTTPVTTTGASVLRNYSFRLVR